MPLKNVLSLRGKFPNLLISGGKRWWDYLYLIISPVDLHHLPGCYPLLISRKLTGMAETENLGSFIKEAQKLARKYLDTRLEIYRLQAIRLLSKASGHLLWIIISLMMLLLFAVFAGLVTAFWLSDVLGSHTRGFGITAIIILLVIFLLFLFRRTLFINPIIRNIIKHTHEETSESSK
jgi:hypothetical protein